MIHILLNVEEKERINCLSLNFLSAKYHHSFFIFIYTCLSSMSNIIIILYFAMKRQCKCKNHVFPFNDPHVFITFYLHRYFSLIHINSFTVNASVKVKWITCKLYNSQNAFIVLGKEKGIKKLYHSNHSHLFR